MEWLIGLVLIAIAAIGALLALVSRYRRCPSNKILVIYGKTSSGAAKCVHGGAAFVWPLIQDFAYLDLEPFVVPIDLKNALSQENIRVTVPTTVTAAISNTKGVMQNAAVRLLGLSRQEIEDQAQDIILGQMRAVIATMLIEEINRDRQAFLAKVNEAVSGELEKIGLYLINVNIRDIEDESGYIEALGRRAAAEAINQALVDVAEQEKLGQTGVAIRERDKRVAVAAATASAEIGEAEADRDRRSKSAGLDAEAALGETEARAKKAAYEANQSVAEEEARNRRESAAKDADGAIRVAQELAEKNAEEARAQREAARLNATIIVSANADKEQTVIMAEAQKAKAIIAAEASKATQIIGAEGEKQQLIISAEGTKESTIKIAEGEAAGTLAKMTAEGQGVKAILDGKAKGYEALVGACDTVNDVASLLLIEKLEKIAGVQAQAISDLPIEKVIVWDGGGKDGGGLSGLGGRLMGALPPMHDLAKQVGLDLPEFLGKLSDDTSEPNPEEPPAPMAE
ncbi:SPFH domain-containing protein [Pontiellaceae bacterium B1224]|nr:SPFH domain-containing protein [Pontiellaceae bacterium B1224]